MSTIKSAKKVVLNLDNFSKENKAKLDKAQAEGLMDDWVYNVEVSILDENKKYTEEDMAKCFVAARDFKIKTSNPNEPLSFESVKYQSFKDYINSLKTLP